MKIASFIKNKRRRYAHIKFLNSIIADIHNSIVHSSFRSEYSRNKNITIVHGNLENKAKLLKKYNRRLRYFNYGK